MASNTPWLRISRNTATRSCGRTRGKGSTSSGFLSFRSANFARDTSTRTHCQQFGVLAITIKVYLGVPVGDVLIALSISFLAQRGNNVPKSTQAFVDILSFLQPILIVSSSTLLKPFRTGKIDKVE